MGGSWIPQATSNDNFRAAKHTGNLLKMLIRVWYVSRVTVSWWARGQRISSFDCEIYETMSGGNQTEGHSKGKATKARDRAESPDAKRQKLQDGKGGSKWPIFSHSVYA